MLKWNSKCQRNNEMTLSNGVKQLDFVTGNTKCYKFIYCLKCIMWNNKSLIKYCFCLLDTNVMSLEFNGVNNIKGVVYVVWFRSSFTPTNNPNTQVNSLIVKFTILKVAVCVVWFESSFIPTNYTNKQVNSL